MAEATLDDVIHRLKLNNRNTNRALRTNATEQAEAIGSVMGLTASTISNAFDASISRLVTTSSLTINTEAAVEANDRMNETLYEIRDISKAGFDKLFNALAGDSLDEAERRRRQGITNRSGVGADQLSANTAAAGGGPGLLGRLFGGLGLGFGAGIGFGGAGLGLGAALAGGGIGVGAALTGVAALLFAVNELDGAKVRANVGEILAISDDVQGFDLVKVTAALTGLGAGLAIFGIGGGIAGLSDAITNFTNKDWAESIKENVGTLLSITDITFGDVARVSTALGALGAGLILFGGGSALAAGADAIANFASEGWAASVKNNVETLLSISDITFGNVAAVTGALSALGAGLVLFGAGGAAAGISDAVTQFMNAGFAQNIKDNVVTLLSIKDELGGNLNLLSDAAFFTASMAGLGAGLAVFAIGQGAQSMVQTLDKFGDVGFAQTIKDNVATLLSINEMADEGQANKFFNTMTKLSSGLVLFSTGNLFSGLSGAAANILSFFGGGNSAMDQLIKLANTADDLDRVSDSLESVSDALNKFSDIKFDVKQADFSGLIKNIQQSLPLIDALANGKENFFGKNIPSILDDSLKLDELVVAMDKLNNIVDGASNLETVDMQNVGRTLNSVGMVLENRQGQINSQAGLQQTIVVQSNADNSTVNQSNVVLGDTSMPSQSMMNADRYINGF